MYHRVAVVVRTRDRPEFLERALFDIAGQIYTDFEVILINDGGDRASVDSVADRSDLRSRMTILDSHAPGGRSAAANTGVEATAAEFIVLHDDDDLWHPAFLATTVSWLESHPAHGGVSVTTEIIREELRDGVWREYERELVWPGMTHLSLGDMLVMNRIVPISLLYRRVLHDQHGGYDEALATVEDWDFYLRALTTHRIAYLAGEVRAFWTHRPSAGGPAANSAFNEATEHVTNDAFVRDRALSEWVRSHGLALPLFVASVERRLRHEFARELSAALDRQRDEISKLVKEQHPVWTRLRVLLARFNRSLNALRR